MQAGEISWYWFVIAGLAGGVLSGMGMGGGTLLIPALTLFLCVDQHSAQGINMLVFLPGALLALMVHKKEGRLEVKKAMPMLYVSLGGAIGGALIAAWLDAEWLRRAFGGFLIVLAFIRWGKGKGNTRSKTEG